MGAVNSYVEYEETITCTCTHHAHTSPTHCQKHRPLCTDPSPKRVYKYTASKYKMPEDTYRLVATTGPPIPPGPPGSPQFVGPVMGMPGMPTPVYISPMPEISTVAGPIPKGSFLVPAEGMRSYAHGPGVSVVTLTKEMLPVHILLPPDSVITMDPKGVVKVECRPEVLAIKYSDGSARVLKDPETSKPLPKGYKGHVWVPECNRWIWVDKN
ncbi:hypothetical protein EDC01DRAFT_633208 [Geopyxis carbonaria]|nr:hypothetical protein EDC01DRAFT_633208 [Geopyxis carbonaria]